MKKDDYGLFFSIVAHRQPSRTDWVDLVVGFYTKLKPVLRTVFATKEIIWENKSGKIFQKDMSLVDLNATDAEQLDLVRFAVVCGNDIRITMISEWFTARIYQIEQTDVILFEVALIGPRDTKKISRALQAMLLEEFVYLCRKFQATVGFLDFGQKGQRKTCNLSRNHTK